MHRFLYLTVLSTFCTLGGIGSIAAQEPAPDTAAVAPPAVVQTLADAYRDADDSIITAALADSFAYQRLAELVDTFGPRFSGTRNLEDAIDWILGNGAEFHRSGGLGGYAAPGDHRRGAGGEQLQRPGGPCRPGPGQDRGL